MHTRFEPLEKGILGGYAQVERVLDHSVGQIVALKRPTPNAPEATRQLSMEIEVLSRVQHPHLIRLHGHGTDVEGSFAVLAWIEGSTLESTLSHAPLSEDRVRTLLSQLLAALQALHVVSR
jgi:serine/threonine protein kinase